MLNYMLRLHLIVGFLTTKPFYKLYTKIYSLNLHSFNKHYF